MLNLEWREISRETVFETKYGRGVEKVTYQMPDGRSEEFFLKREGNSAVIVALTEDKEILLVRQFRPGKNTVVNDLPGGNIKSDQTPLEAVQAELLEETGYAGDVQFVIEAWPDGYSTRRSFVFVATNCKKVAEPALDENEFIDVQTVSISQFRDHLRSGRLTDIDAGYLGLDFLGLL